jgi:hypothetical protein
LNLFPPHRRAYVRAHPVVLWFSIGVALVGLLALVAPSTTTGTAAILPDWTRVVFNACWLVAGTASAVAIVRGYPQAEAAGMVGLCSGLAAYCVLIVEAIGVNTSVLFVASLAVGCGLRAWHLAHGGGV